MYCFPAFDQDVAMINSFNSFQLQIVAMTKRVQNKKKILSLHLSFIITFQNIFENKIKNVVLHCFTTLHG